MIVNLGNKSKKEWVRDARWLPRPVIAEGEKIVKFLVLVPENSDIYIKLNVSGNFTVNWGDGNTIDYTGGSDPHHLMEYSGITEYLGVTTIKQTWVYETLQSGVVNFGSFVMNDYELNAAPYALCNQSVVEVLLGEVKVTAAYGFSLSQMDKLESVVFVEDFICNTNLTGVFQKDYRLQNLEGYFESNVYNTNILLNTMSLLNIDNFNLVSDGTTCSNMAQDTGVRELKIPSFKLGSARGFLVRARTIRAELDFSQLSYAYQFAYEASALEEIELVNGNGSGCTNFYQSFYKCNFKETPALDLSSSTINSAMFNFVYKLQKINVFNVQADIGFNSCMLTHAEIERVVDNGQFLYSAVGYTVDYRNNPDIANLPSSVIAKYTALNITLLLS